MNMKKQIITAFRMALANLSLGQDVICRPRASIGGPDFVAQRVCRTGYGRVGTTNQFRSLLTIFFN